jgi:hypothetical protein
MKRLLIFGALLLLVTVGLTSCYKDVILPKVATTKPPQFVSFSNDLQPVFTTNCALSGCHVKGGQTPYLTPDVSYHQLLGGYVNTIKAEQSELYIMINGNMQVHIPDAADRQRIYDWIRNGAPNN